MFNSNGLKILVMTEHVYEKPMLMAYGKILAHCLGAKVIHAKTTSPESHWAEVGEAALELSPSIIVAAWPAESRSIQDAQNAAGSARLLLVDMRPHEVEDFRRIVAPWSGNPLSLGRLQLASRLASGLDLPGHVLRIIGTQGLPADRRALAQHFRQVRQRERVELALSAVALPVHFRVSDDAVGETVVRIKPHDLVIVGSSNDWLLHDHPTAAASWDIRHSVNGPVAMLIDPDQTPVTLQQVFQEDAILIGTSFHADIAQEMVSLLVNQRQVPWSWKPRILERVKEISLGKRVLFMHAQIPRHGQIVSSMCIERGAGGRVHFLVLVPQQGYDTYLPVLAKLAELASNESNVEALIACRTPAEALSILRKIEIGRGLLEVA